MTFFRVPAFCLLPLFLLLAGCATPMVHFTSRPTGARVKMGAAEDHTPCMMALLPDDRTATVSLPEDPAKFVEVPLPEYPGLLRRGVATCAQVGGDSCTLISMPFLIAGAAGLFVCYLALDHGWALGSERAGENWLLLLGGSAGSVAVGGLFYAAGKGVEYAAPGRYDIYVDLSRFVTPPTFEAGPPAADVTYRLFPPAGSTNGAPASNTLHRTILPPWVDINEWLEQQRTNR